ncbi:MAG: hypothetical protein CMA64_06945 [Euryarchaeota archaeon]|nr:hypothetical protein [Euryarchaeota archaeon]
MTQIQEVTKAIHAKLDLVERQREHYEQQKQITKHQNKKIQITELMLKAYWDNLDRFSLYNKQSQLERAQAEQGRFLDIEVK